MRGLWDYISLLGALDTNIVTRVEMYGLALQLQVS